MTKIGDDKDLERAMKSPFFQEEHILEQEDGEHDLIEITSKKKTILDERPLVMANCILQLSKLHFLKFVYHVLFEFLKPGAYRICYADTDSLCLGELKARIYLIKIKLHFIKFYFSFNKNTGGKRRKSSGGNGSNAFSNCARRETGGVQKSVDQMVCA